MDMCQADITARRNRKIKRGIGRFLIYLGVIIMCAWAVFPVFWMVSISLRQPIYTFNPAVWFFRQTLVNYIAVFVEQGFLRFLINSVIVAVFSTLLAMVIGTLAAYGFSRYRFKYNSVFLFILLFIRTLPAIAIVIPIFLIARFLGVLDTRVLLVFVYLIFNVPFTVWMMKGFFDEIPKEIEEAGMVDGCTSLQSLRLVILPIVQPGLVATAIFCIISSWNEFIFSMILTSMRSMTAPAIVGRFLSVTGVAWGEMSAVGTMAIIPVLVFAMIVQKNMIRGLSFGAVKG